MRLERGWLTRQATGREFGVSKNILYYSRRIMARRDAAGVRLLTRNGYDFAGRFPLAAAAVAALSARSCLIDGEAIVTDQKGLAARGVAALRSRGSMRL